MQGWPVAGRGQVVGLLGGSFDPAHQGHVHITLTALARFGLDQVWWLVSPGNPLKPQGPAPLDTRIARARTLMDHPRVRITGIETLSGTRHTARTLAWLTKRYPHVRFVWLMGADNLIQFHRWQDWRGILDRVPVGVLARPGLPTPAGLSRAARATAARRLPERQARALSAQTCPAWCLVNLPLSDLSSSAIRAGRQS